MEPIIRAILDSDYSAMRSIIALKPEVLQVKADSGRSPLQVAYNMHNVQATALILRQAPECIEEVSFTPKELLESLIADFSQSTLCSGWNQDIEYDLWAMVINDESYPHSYDRYMAVDRDYISDIAWVASWVEGWFHWPDSGDGPRFIPMPEWEERYEQKTKR